MNRLVMMVALIGGLISYNGAQDLKLSAGTTPEPLRVSLSDLESGRVPVNAHLRIGQHWAMHHELAFLYGAKRDDANAELDAVYYPIVATDHAYFRELETLEARYRGRAKIPEDRHPELDGFSVLVRTERYGTIESLPDPEWAMAPSVTGIIANHVRPITRAEIDLVAANFPHVDPDTLLVLEEGRLPAPAGYSYARIGGGFVVALSPLALLAFRSRRVRTQSSENSLCAEASGSASVRPCSSLSDSRNA